MLSGLNKRATVCRQRGPGPRPEAGTTRWRLQGDDGEAMRWLSEQMAATRQHGFSGLRSPPGTVAVVSFHAGSLPVIS